MHSRHVMPDQVAFTGPTHPTCTALIQPIICGLRLLDLVGKEN